MNAAESKNPAQTAPQAQIAIPAVPVNLPVPAVDLILRALGKLPYEEVAEVADSLRNVTQAHVQHCIAAHEAAQKADPSTPKDKLKPTAAAAKAVTKARSR